MESVDKFWTLPSSEVLAKLDSRTEGLTDEAAKARKALSGERKPPSAFVKDLVLLLRQFKNPLVLILVVAVLLSSALAEYTNAAIISGIILLTGLLGFWQERNASRAVEKLRELVRVKVTVRRSGAQKDIGSEEVVPGDIVVLNAGDVIPADCLLLESRDLHVNESALTGESFPAEKEPGVLPADLPLAKRKNCVFKGTNVVSGTATALTVFTGTDTEFGKISSELEKQIPETESEAGIRKFGYMLMRVTLVLSLAIMGLNIYYGKPISDSFLFALALAVGMTPELLPAIVTITHSAGAKRMAKKKVIVKKLSAIQSLGGVNVFCSDKTGTLTEGIIRVHSALDIEGKPSDRILRYAFLNASFETGFSNPLDQAIRDLKNVSTEGYVKFDEVPYDFIRKRLSIVVEKDQKHLMITKGALKNILDVCTTAETGEGKTAPLHEWTRKIVSAFEKYSSDGFRTIGVCYKDVTGDPVINLDDETGMVFQGFILLSDPLKEGISEAIKQLNDSGISLKLITGDNKFIAAHIGKQIGIDPGQILTGSQLQKISGQALVARVRQAAIFAEVEPGQKERIVQALRKGGNVVGFIGDGINDVSALKAADVGISVDTAVDVAKETADIVLLQRGLDVLHEGILEGRKTHLNIQKYIFMATSANFGNMFSVAGSSLFLPFLPLLPKQILLTNFLTDIPEMTISSDNVDGEMIRKPLRMNINFIRKFMVVFGLISSVFDFLTFGVLYYFLHAAPDEFRTGWFIESVVSAAMIVLVIRTYKPFYRSRPSKYLVLATIGILAVTIFLPYTPVAPLFNFVPLPAKFLLFLSGILVAYAAGAELAKRIFFKRLRRQA